MEARTRTQRHVLAIFANFCCVAKVAAWAENAGNAGSKRSIKGAKWTGVHGLAVNLPLLLFLKRFSISSFSSSVYLPSPRSASLSPTLPLPFSRSLSFAAAVVVIAAIEVLFYAQFVRCGV